MSGPQKLTTGPEAAGVSSGLLRVGPDSRSPGVRPGEGADWSRDASGPSHEGTDGERTKARRRRQGKTGRPGLRHRRRRGREYSDILELQRTAGNQATTRFVEARLARRAPAPSAVSSPNGRWPAGEPLELRLRSKLERQFGQSLDGLRLDHEEEGRRVAERYDALAVSHDDHLYFAPGTYAPGSSRGDRILRHEVTHYLQSRRGRGRAERAWPSQALEAEAQRAAAGGRGPAEVAGLAPAGRPLFIKTFVSTVGGNPYLDQAVKFYLLWENEKAVRVGSYQDIVTKLATEPSPLSQFRIVSHGNGDQLFLPLLAGARSDVWAARSDLDLQTQQSQLGRLGDSTIGVHLADDLSSDVHAWLQASVSGKSLLATLGLSGALSGSWQEYIRWVVDEYFLEVTKEATPPKGGPKRTSPGRVASLKQEVGATQAAARAVVSKKLAPGATTNDVDALRAAILGELRARSFKWGEAPPGFYDAKLSRLLLKDIVALRREVATGSLEKNLAIVKGWVDGNTYVEIRGCKIGSNPEFLRGIQRFFGSAPDRLPSISAPMLYQFYGRPGALVLPEGGKAAPLADSLKFLFEETFNDTSLAKEVNKAIGKARLQSVSGLAGVLRFAGIKGEFQAWWEMKQKAKGGAAASITTATLKDFQDFLTTAPARTFPVNAPGVAPQSIWYVILLPSTAIDALTAWVQDQGYKLPGGADLKKTLFGKGGKWDPGSFSKGLSRLTVDWLGDDYPVPKKIYFREDPQYRANIRRLPGSGPAKAAAGAKPGAPAATPQGGRPSGSPAAPPQGGRR